VFTHRDGAAAVPLRRPIGQEKTVERIDKLLVVAVWLGMADGAAIVWCIILRAPMVLVLVSVLFTAAIGGVMVRIESKLRQ
jgi:hypothetical protein